MWFDLFLLVVTVVMASAAAFGSGYLRGYARCEKKWLSAFGYFGERWMKMEKNALLQKERQEMKDEKGTTD